MPWLIAPFVIVLNCREQMHVVMAVGQKKNNLLRTIVTCRNRRNGPNSRENKSGLIQVGYRLLNELN